MAPPHPQCVAVAAAQQKTGLTNDQLASQIGVSVSRVNDIITGAAHPTQQEFAALAKALGITDAPPKDAAHQTA